MSTSVSGSPPSANASPMPAERCVPRSLTANCLCCTSESRSASREIACSIFSSSSVCGIVVGRIILLPIRSRSSCSSRSNRHPALDVRDAGLGEHVRDRVAHAEVGRHRAVEHAVEHAEDIGRRAAMSTPTTFTARRFASSSMMRPIAPGVGMIGTSVQLISFAYPGACCITCSRNSSWNRNRAPARGARARAPAGRCRRAAARRAPRASARYRA